MRALRRTALIACWTLVATASWSQLPTPTGRPGMAAAQPGPGAADINKSLESQRAAFEVYQKCIRDNDKAYRLHSISKQLIDVRDNRERLERFIANNPEAKARFRSFEEELPRAMEEYRKAGGTAASIAEISPLPNPCASVQPGPKPPPHRSDEKDSKSAISASVSIRNPKPTAPPGPPAREPELRRAAPTKAGSATAVPSRSRSHQDARECLKLGSDKAIMACAEKFR